MASTNTCGNLCIGTHLLNWSAGTLSRMDLRQVPAANNEMLLTCPSGCETSYVHLDEAVISDHAAALASVRVPGTEVIDLPTPTAMRNHVISLPGWCDACGTQFVLNFTQHKGQTYVSVTEVSRRSEGN